MTEIHSSTGEQKELEEAKIFSQFLTPQASVPETSYILHSCCKPWRSCDRYLKMIFYSVLLVTGL